MVNRITSKISLCRETAAIAALEISLDILKKLDETTQGPIHSLCGLLI